MSDDPDALLVRADKKMVTTLTRWKPDYDAAAQLYEEAGGKFRALGRKRDAMIALEKCAHANAQTGDDWHAFCRDNDDLFGRAVDILGRYYSPELLASDAARETFVLPDRGAVRAA